MKALRPDRGVPPIGAHTLLSPRTAALVARLALAFTAAAVVVAAIGLIAAREAAHIEPRAKPQPPAKITERWHDANGNPVERAP
ncbi:MAG: hypothetical protein ACK4UO_06030 [Pseudolabrys sp.]